MESVASALDSSPLPFLHLIHELKHLPRTGWLRTIDNPESVAAHSFRLAFLAAFAPEGLDRHKCLFIALCHDLGESVVGDIPTFAGVPKERKHKLEHSAFQYIRSLLMPARRDLADQIIDSWQDYEEGRSKEALWVREMDKLECMIQAHEYEQQTFGEKDLEEFQGLTPKIISPEGKLWLELLQSERHAHLAKRRYRLPVIFIAGQTNDPNIQAALTSSETWLQFLSLDSILRKKAEDQAYIHAEFLRQCLEEELPVPRSLSVNLLEQTIQEGLQQGKWTVVYGFPADKEHLLEFERKVQKTNYSIFLETTGGTSSSQELKKCMSVVEGYFKEIPWEVGKPDLVKDAINGFVKHFEELAGAVTGGLQGECKP